MAQAAALVIGEHDFTSFAAVDPGRSERMVAAETRNHRGHRGTHEEGQSRETNVRTIYSSAWTREGDELIYTVSGSGFLHHMVRNLVGTFLLVGKRALTPEDFLRVLAAHDRSAAGPTAPAKGLYLVSVEYAALGT
jgi:tRNA pseudouridine38-40 synthase